jgi:hypothetical protein
VGAGDGDGNGDGDGDVKELLILFCTIIPVVCTKSYTYPARASGDVYSYVNIGKSIIEK